VPFVFEVENAVSLAVGVLLLGVNIFAFVNSLFFSRESYVAAGKLTKLGWVAILGVGLALQLLFIRASPINILNIAFTVAAFVYLADVRPALGGLRRR
jgi:hypothetical protein